MRHLIDTYIEAQAPRKISPFDGIGLLDLTVKPGIADAIAERLPAALAALAKAAEPAAGEA